LPLTQTQLASALADRAEITRADAKRLLGVREEIVLDELGNAQKVRIGGLVQLTVRVKPAQKKRPGRNPATGETITIAASPRALIYARDRWRRPRLPCHRCKRPGAGSPPNSRLPPPPHIPKRTALPRAVASPPGGCPPEVRLTGYSRWRKLRPSVVLGNG
jgi:DNA-binding protein HU-beta